MIIKYIVLLAITGLLLGSCDDNRVYENNFEFKDRTWKVTEEPRFEFVVTDTTSSYNLYYNVRNSLNYPFTRINVTYRLYDSAGNELSKRLVYNDLFQKTGEPLGRSGLGDLYDHRFLLLQHYKFKQKARYSVKLEQFMRADTLAGMIAVGVRVEKDLVN